MSNDISLKELSNFYGVNTPSQRVRKIKVDTDKLNERLREKDIDNYKESIYDKYEITFYRNKQEFIEGLPSEVTNKKHIDRLWEEYKHRDDLITTGQYDDFRVSIYKENYVKEMKKIGMSKKEIELIKNMDNETFSKLAFMPKGDKTNVNDTIIPKLGGFQYAALGISDKALKDYREGLRSDFIKAFEQLGLKYEYGDDTGVDKSVLKKKTTLLRRLINKEDRIEIEYKGDEVSDYDIALHNIDIYTSNNELKIKTSKKGYLYIPFVGSTNPKSKNKDLFDDILNELSERGYWNK